MAIKLRETESIKVDASIHWSAYILEKVWACLGVVVISQSMSGQIFGEKTKVDVASIPGFILLVIFFAPVICRWFQYSARKYTVTDQRVYIETGVLARSINDIPLHKINDVTLKQSLSQRMIGAGDIVILTGNDLPTIIAGIARPDAFREILSEMISKKSAV